LVLALNWTELGAGFAVSWEPRADSREPKAKSWHCHHITRAPLLRLRLAFGRLSMFIAAFGVKGTKQFPLP